LGGDVDILGGLKILLYTSTYIIFNIGEKRQKIWDKFL
jgi:hypothetical protein